MKRRNEMDEFVYEFTKAKGIVVCGDIHGDFTQLVFKCWTSGTGTNDTWKKAEG